MRDPSNAPLREFSLQVCYCANEFGVLFLNPVNDFKSAPVNIPVVFARSTRHLLFQSLAVLKDFSTERQRAGRNRG
jgi:flagellar motor component MotA